MAAFVPPSVAVAEVTVDIRFTGGPLATMTRSELREQLSEFGLAI